MPWKDPERRRKYYREYYSANKKKRQQTVTIQKKKVHTWFQEYKATLRCLRCGENHPACIQFHHRNPADKVADVNWLSWRGLKKQLLAEIAKCDVLCANCHAKIHYKGGFV